MSVPIMQKFVNRQLLESKNIFTEKQTFSLHCEGSISRKKLEDSIGEKYYRIHNACISEFMPLLLQLTKDDEQQAVLGLKPGHYKRMFLERYLDSPIEQQVASISKQPVDRHTLIEVGNLAVTRRGAGLLLFVVLAMSLAKAGYEWMVFTVTDEVERLMNRLGFDPQYLKSAKSDSFEGDWGRYYENNPKVMVGNLTKAVSIAKSQPVLTKVIETYYQDINALASSLLDYRRLANG